MVEIRRMGYDVDTLRQGPARAASVSAAISAGTPSSHFNHMSGPVPSNLVLLSDLGSCAPGTKVRFLGWCVRHPFTKQELKCW